LIDPAQSWVRISLRGPHQSGIAAENRGANFSHGERLRRFMGDAEDSTQADLLVEAVLQNVLGPNFSTETHYAVLAKILSTLLCSRLRSIMNT
jgi:hypothetical protein